MNASSIWPWLTGLASTLACAAPGVVECPRLLPAKEISLSPPPGWQFYAESPLYLHSAAPMVTPPEGLGHLIENVTRKRNGDVTYVYRFDGFYPEGKWIQCAYRESDQLTLSRRLDEKTQQCLVTYRKGEKAGENRIKVLCE